MSLSLSREQEQEEDAGVQVLKNLEEFGRLDTSNPLVWRREASNKTHEVINLAVTAVEKDGQSENNVTIFKMIRDVFVNVQAIITTRITKDN